jgi:hypothetical protein
LEYEWVNCLPRLKDAINYVDGVHHETFVAYRQELKIHGKPAHGEKLSTD